MKIIFKKTDHFLKRTWERSFYQEQIDKLISGIKPPKGKSIAIFGRKSLSKADIKLPNTSHLVIVMKDNVLITIYTVPDLFYFLKSISNKAQILLF